MSKFVRVVAKPNPMFPPEISIFEQPNSDSRLVGKLPTNSIVLRVDIANNRRDIWGKIIYDDVIGWIRSTEIGAMFVIDLSEENEVIEERQVWPVYAEKTPTSYPYYTDS